MFVRDTLNANRGKMSIYAPALVSSFLLKSCPGTLLIALWDIMCPLLSKWQVFKLMNFQWNHQTFNVSKTFIFPAIAMRFKIPLCSLCITGLIFAKRAL